MQENPTKNTVTLKIKDKIFNISFVSNYVVYEWTKIHQIISDVSKETINLQKLMNDIKDNKGSIEENEKKLRDIEEKIRSKGTDSFFEKRMNLVKEICESNEIEFNRRWWERKTEPSDVIFFLNECFNKDLLKKTLKKVS